MNIMVFLDFFYSIFKSNTNTANSTETINIVNLKMTSATNNISSSEQQAALYQKIFKKIYESRAGTNKNSWEYFSLGLTVYQWLTENDPVYTHTLVLEDVLDAVYEIFDIIISILEMLKSNSSLLAPIVYYSNSFVKRAGIKHNQLFNLLLTSTIVTLKFWSESVQIRNILLADIFEFPVKDINIMEKRFLSGIDYNLNISQDEISEFLARFDKSYHERFQKLKHFKEQQAIINQIIKNKNQNNNNNNNINNNKKQLSKSANNISTTTIIISANTQNCETY
ncbi:hypothetical protein ACTA71_002970 [Dictyostelium dimigraforme]